MSNQENPNETVVRSFKEVDPMPAKRDGQVRLVDGLTVNTKTGPIKTNEIRNVNPNLGKGKSTKKPVPSFGSRLSQAVGSIFGKKRPNVTLTPAHFICHYDSLNMSVEEISGRVKLPTDIVSQCIVQAKEQGIYQDLLDQFEASMIPEEED